MCEQLPGGIKCHYLYIIYKVKLSLYHIPSSAILSTHIHLMESQISLLSVLIRPPTTRECQDIPEVQGCHLCHQNQEDESQYNPEYLLVKSLGHPRQSNLHKTKAPRGGFSPLSGYRGLWAGFFFLCVSRYCRGRGQEWIFSTRVVLEHNQVPSNVLSPFDTDTLYLVPHRYLPTFTIIRLSRLLHFDYTLSTNVRNYHVVFPFRIKCRLRERNWSSDDIAGLGL